MNAPLDIDNYIKTDQKETNYDFGDGLVDDLRVDSNMLFKGANVTQENKAQLAEPVQESPTPATVETKSLVES